MSATSETSSQPSPTLRADYRPPAWRIDAVDLHFELDPEATRVRARCALRREAAADEPLVLVGEELELLSIAVDGQPLDPARYDVEERRLTVRQLPAQCTLETEVRIAPARNRALSGLYVSSGNFCTQCEAEGFRRITWFLDRPDVMARYTTTLVADRERYPVMLSNGNRVATEVLEDGRHLVRWEDPFPKPSYLFALVAGDLHCHSGSFTAASGREVRLEFYVEARDADKCEHALRSLQKAMRWDEETFGLEYDLDLYMIVAVGDFNMGAMENKGLNLFNSKFVLARPDTATDQDFEGIEGVIAHEYFHNRTGNRVTCRDWFQLTLKEGLTVYRDQEFSAQMTSAPVQRIGDVRLLRERQFPEDAGPMAHPIRPEAYVEMDNFYTATVYDKGAEVVRMYQVLLGREGFRRGMDRYFERHDGQAVTCDDFRAAMADANGRDLTQFERWYSQAGTPRLAARGEWDGDAESYTLELRQECPRGQDAAAFQPLHVPVRVGLVGRDGGDLALRLDGEQDAPRERVLELTGRSQTWTFRGVGSPPVPSLLRGYSAPVALELERGRDELAFLLANDSDAFNRWDAGQALFGGMVLELAAAHAAGEALVVDPAVVEAYRSVLLDGSIDGSIRALTITLPEEGELAQQMAVVDPDALHAARQHLSRELAAALRDELLEVYRLSRPRGPYTLERDAVDRRRTKNAALAALAVLEEAEITSLIVEQFEGADNMTDSQAALAALVGLDVPERAQALEAFHRRWHEEPLVLDKWFSLQADSTLPGAPARVRELMAHPDFTLDNPNRARSLVGHFSTYNHVGFHDASGEGYAILADAVLAIDPKNPQLAARLLKGLNAWRRYDPGRQEHARRQLERVRATDGLSRNSREIVERSVATE